MTAHAFPNSVLGHARENDSMFLTDQESPRLVVLTGRSGVSEDLAEMCEALEIDLIAVNSHHDLPFRLHHHRPIGVVSELDPSGLASCAALRSIAAYDSQMPVLLVAGIDPSGLGTIDAAEQLWGLSGLHRLVHAPSRQDLVGFLFKAGRRSGIGRLIPLS